MTLSSLVNAAAVAPSMQRWSTASVSVITVAVASAPFLTTGLCAPAPMLRMAPYVIRQPHDQPYLLLTPERHEDPATRRRRAIARGQIVEQARQWRINRDANHGTRAHGIGPAAGMPP